jgi:hypothetical protein
MKLLSFVVVATLTAVAGGMLWFAVGGPDSVGDDARTRELKARLEEAQAQMRAKDEVTAALARGELTFDEAAARFRAIHGGDPGPLGSLRLQYPGASDEELYHRNVVLYVQRAARNGVPGAAAILSRLESDLARRFPATGKHLPRPNT